MTFVVCGVVGLSLDVVGHLLDAGVAIVQLTQVYPGPENMAKMEYVVNGRCCDG